MASQTLKVGWAEVDITPQNSIALCGQFHVRLSEGVQDPITATVLVIDDGNDHVVFVSCDLVAVSIELQNEVVAQLADRAEGLDPRKMVMNATHTHTAPEIRLQMEFRQNEPWASSPRDEVLSPLNITAAKTMEFIRFAGGRIADAVAQAWNSRTAGGIAFGMDYAVVGRNRRWVNIDGVARMYGNTDNETFSHIEGYEDHSVGVVAMRDGNGNLTGLIVNVPCPSQISSQLYVLSADFWHETRLELRKRFGETLFILPQCSAAGDLSPRVMYDKSAHNRMLQLAGRSERQEIAVRIADAVQRVLNTLGNHADATAPLKHRVDILPLPRNCLTKEQVEDALAEADTWKNTYEEELQKLRNDPSLKDQSRWYVPVSQARSRMFWYQGVADRYDQQEKNASDTFPCEYHVVRLGDIVFATNPFEYYLDFGVFIKARSKAVQTFLVQLAGEGASYVPSQRSTQGGGYGSSPTSNPVGPEGGRILAEKTIEVIENLW